jgi:hypothetical protein
MMRLTLNRLYLWFLTSIAVVGFLPFLAFPEISNHHPGANERKTATPTHRIQGSTVARQKSCALCFFGLPRSFELLVLPSIIQNILIPNKQNRCDLYFHYYRVQAEKKGRSGYGGLINREDIDMLYAAVKQVYIGESGDIPHVSITSDTDEDFLRKRGAQLKKYRKTKGTDGKYLYYPWMAKSFKYPTSIDNIVKQWHSINSAWNEMEKNALTFNKDYKRVAMLRNDVVYITPFDIYNASKTKREENDEYVGIPSWARYPINDRMIYGSYRGVKIWSTERFERLESHVVTYEPGYGMHSERFLNHSIFPAIRDLGIKVIENPDICFFRARADGSAWINDCSTINGAARGFRRKDTQILVENLIGRKCRKTKFNRKTIQLHCNSVNNTDSI